MRMHAIMQSVRGPHAHTLQATSDKLKAASYKLQATSYKLQATSYKLQVTSYKLQADDDELVHVLLKAGASPT